MDRKSFLITFGVVMAVIIAILCWGWCRAQEEPWDVSCPMTNTNITWAQTYHPGAWNT